MTKIKKLVIELIFEYDKDEVKNIMVTSPFNDDALHYRIVNVIIQYIQEQIGAVTTYIR